MNDKTGRIIDNEPEADSLDEPVARLANVLMFEFEDAFRTTDGSEGACDMAIRVLREQAAVLAMTQRALARANAYIDMLNRGTKPVHSTYWPTIQRYTQAMEELREAMGAAERFAAERGIDLGEQA